MTPPARCAEGGGDRGDAQRGGLEGHLAEVHDAVLGDAHRVLKLLDRRAGLPAVVVRGGVELRAGRVSERDEGGVELFHVGSGVALRQVAVCGH